MSNKTTTPGKNVKGNDDDTTSVNTLAGNSFMTTDGNTTIATMTHYAGYNLGGEEDNDSFASSIAFVIFMKSNPANNMDAEDFHVTQKIIPL